jgi:Mg-chelatase subunit ChlD
MQGRLMGRLPAMRRGGMLAVALLLVLAMLDPPIPWSESGVELILVMDDSSSLGPAGADRAWHTLLPLLRRLPAGSTLTLIRFGVEPVIELHRQPIRDQLPPLLPRARPISHAGSDIAAAINAIPAGGSVLLTSDGLGTTPGLSSALDRLAVTGTPVSWWHLPDVLPDAWISSIDAPAQVAADTAIPVTLTLGAAKVSTRLLSLAVDGQVQRRRQVSVPTTEPLVLQMKLPALAAGVHHVSARLSDLPERSQGAPPTASPAAQASTLTRVDGGASVLLIGEDTKDLASALAAGSWAVKTRGPGDLRATELAEPSVIILNDVPVAALGPRHWQQLADAVIGRGSGLLVLGGSHSFAAGGYRHSTIEQILPLLSEPPNRLPAATALFAIDNSGSMGQPISTGLTRHALARIAAADAAAVLGAKDKVGLVLFGAEAELVLAPRRRQDQRLAITTATSVIPGGGTRLGPLLAMALTQLAGRDSAIDHPPGAAGELPGGSVQTDKPMRLLVVLSDGQFADNDDDMDPAALGARLAASGIEVIAIGIGDPDRAVPLRLLAEASGGRFHQVPRASALPAFVAERLQARRTAPHLGPFLAFGADELPFSTPQRIERWPAVAAFQPTRLREHASAVVITGDEDPLLAWQRTGLGRVVALPAGLGEFAPDWRRWDALPTLLGAMLAWLSGDDPGSPLFMETEHTPRGIRFTVDMTDSEGAWSTTRELDWRIDRPGPSPLGADARGRVAAIAPGRFEAELSAPQAGRYDMALFMDGREQRRSVWYEPRVEWLPSPVTRASLDALLTLPRWTPEADWPPADWPARPQGAGRVLAAAALLLFLGLVVMERLGREDLLRALHQALRWWIRPWRLTRRDA